MSAIIIILDIVWLVLALIATWGMLDMFSTCHNSFGYRSCSFDYQNIVRLSMTFFASTVVVTLITRFSLFKSSSAIVTAMSLFTIVSAGMFGVVSFATIWQSSTGSNYVLWRTLLMTIILMIFGTIATLLLARMEKNKIREVQANTSTPPASTTPVVDEQQLRRQIETEVRARIAIEEEVRAKIAAEQATTNNASDTTENSW